MFTFSAVGYVMADSSILDFDLRNLSLGDSDNDGRAEIAFGGALRLVLEYLILLGRSDPEILSSSTGVKETISRFIRAGEELVWSIPFPV
jgi:hypothetical protein